MIRGMTRRGDCLEIPSIASHHIAINKLEIGMEFAITTGIKTLRFIEVELARGAMRPLTEGWRARCGLDACCSGRVVAMSMRDQDMRDHLVSNRIEERLDVRFVKWPWVNDGNAISAHNIADRSLERKRSRIVAQQPPQARVHFLDLAGRKVEALVERDIVAHRTTGDVEARWLASRIAPLTPPLRLRTSLPWPTSRSLPR